MTVRIATLLIANRGEIACRIMRTARDLGIRTVAVYSDADADAPHVRQADDSVRIGPAPVGESYLVIEHIIDAARASGADAIHPGYGFVSENADFARACADAGLTFVGPPVRAIEIMGDKAASKRAMIDAGVPCVPGYQGADQSDDALIAEAEKVGLPLMVKAAAGGGGRGMRLVRDAGAIPDAIRAARSEAQNAFGNGELILERAIENARHVELQVFADDHGTTLHLGERDCSVQRRHQKVIEEAPCPVMTEELRTAMGDAAVEAARAVDYRGAGTVEFLLDADGGFYFLEMNTRLQVEHPVTEMVTGLDLVALQLRVAHGLPLDLEQDDVALSGHAIEARLYAEDPSDGFLPSTGDVALWYPPEHARVDAGIATGGAVSPFYDSMVAKIICHGDTREAARRAMVGALGRTALFGPASNRDFLIDALERPDFVEGRATTSFVTDNYGDVGEGVALDSPPARAFAIAAVLHHKARQAEALGEAIGVNRELLDWSSERGLRTVLRYDAAGGIVRVHVLADGDYRVEIAREEGLDEEFAVSVSSIKGAEARVKVDGRTVDAVFHADGRTLFLALPEHTLVLTDQAGLSALEEQGSGGTVRAPMHGQLLDILVDAGDTVARGDKLAVLEAMKMQHEIRAEIAGTVTEIAATAGTQIAADDLILEIEEHDE